MTDRTSLRLRVRQIDQFCVFDLSGLAGEEISATLKYPANLTDLYQNWQQIYCRRYALQTRARVGSKSGSGTPTSYDWDQELKIAEAALLQAFDSWIGQAELLGIRETIQRRLNWTATPRSPREQGVSTPVDILLDCSPLSLARLPWETWKLAPRGAASQAIRIARTCTPAEPADPVRSHRRSKIRVLVILADAPDLNHESDQKALRSLSPVADIEWIHCQEFTHALHGATLKQRIADAIADQHGWDMLFFAGHSNEAAIAGGKLELAPQTALSISEIEPQLLVAKQRGLQLAVFNSCCGMQIAESLMRLGLPQVVVMREQIQDAVAHKFLEQFCRSLSRYNDVHTAVSDATEYFASEAISYPSAHLIPSLFRHPDPTVALFQIEPASLKHLWQRWKPTRWEAIALGTFTFCSLVVPFQELLADVRYWSQSVYRQTTDQIPPLTPPAVTLLKIDQDSINRKGLDAYKIKPMSRAYLAELVDRLRQLNVRVIGVDYLLDGSTREDAQLATTVQSAIRQRSWFVFATHQNATDQSIRVTPSIAKPDWILQGDISILGWNLMLPATAECRANCPFGYQLAIAHLTHPIATASPQLSPAKNLQHQVSQTLSQTTVSHPALTFLRQPQAVLGLQPVIDFSLPPNRVYQAIATWEFLERPLNDATLKSLQQQVVIIGSGGYDQADDNFSLPLAIQYWRSLNGPLMADTQLLRSQVLPGATVHAYSLHHILSQHLLFPIPALWMMGLFAIFGKGATLILSDRKPQPKWRFLRWMLGGTIGYGFVCLQLYVTVAIILPWFLPSALLWLYMVPELKRGR